MRHIRWLGIVVVLCLLVVRPAYAIGTPKAQIQAVSLQLNDLPTGFTLKANTYTTTKSGALEQDTEYTRSGMVGMIDVRTLVVLFRTTATARNAYRDLTIKSRPKGAQPMSVAPVGDNRLGFTIVQKSNTFTIEADAIIFQRTGYVVLVQGAGVHDTFGADTVFGLAKTIDNRIIKQTK